MAALSIYVKALQTITSQLVPTVVDDMMASRRPVFFRLQKQGGGVTPCELTMSELNETLFNSLNANFDWPRKTIINHLEGRLPDISISAYIDHHGAEASIAELRSVADTIEAYLVQQGADIIRELPFDS
ncbi:hypothetical protein GCM10025776_03250 [Corallincola platygyrae]